jgi:WD40 repeat protein
MTKTGSKKSPVVMFIGAFVVIVIVMIIANQSKDVGVALVMPFNEGIRSLSTYENKLLAVASDGKTFIWDWDRLDQKAVVGKAAFEQALLLDIDSVISIKQGRSATIVVSSVQDEKIEKEIRLDSDTDLGIISANRDRSTFVAILAVSSDSKDWTDYEFYNIDLEGKRAFRINKASDDNSLIQLTDFAVSDDGRFIAAAGERGHKARLMLIDIGRQRLLWDNIYDKPNGFGSIVFSFDGKTIYAGGDDGTVYYFQTSDGELIDHFKFREETSVAHETISVQNLTFSPDGTLLAYTYGFKIYIFDHKNKTEIHSQRPGQKLPGPIVFSPDSSQIATSDFRQGGKIKIWPVPEH